MLKISELKLPVDHTGPELEQKLLHTLGIRTSDLLSWRIVRRSLDARKKPELYYVYSVEARVKHETAVQKRRRRHVQACVSRPYVFPESGSEPLACRPCIVGSGPAGLFCAYLLAGHGYRPILLERGAPVGERMRDVRHFWETGALNPESNVQFGEGGAGTFSDGKLNTLVGDADGRGKKVLEIFVENGAPDDILYESRPHIGTDHLTDVVLRMRKQIEAWGGEVRFHSRLSDIKAENGALRAVTINDCDELRTDVLVLAPGHSARDTFAMLQKRGIRMQAKAFAVGVRCEHLQTMIDAAQYGRARGNLPAASYKLTARTPNGRGVYSFCMCPGGYVVNASSDEGMLAVNGMSYRDRNGTHANSAIVVTVAPEDFGGDDVLAGVRFQRRLERAAYTSGGGRIPVQRLEDFCEDRRTTAFGSLTPNMKGQYAMANLRNVLPEDICESLRYGFSCFDRKIPGFSAPDTLLSGVESRTSSPVRIVRDDTFQASVRGLYPCGEGAGYAGGITSAAIDGIRIAEAIAKRFACKTL